MKEKWILYGKKADFDGISAKYGIDPVTARVMRNREIITDREIYEYLEGGLKDLHSPHLLKDADKAADLILAAIEEKKAIAVASDFDNDGIFSAMILYESIRRLGGTCEIFTPHRILEGYGLNDRIVREAKEQGFGMILTCDNGIAAFDAVSLAKELGMTVIITDHHEIPYEEADGDRHYRMPAADAIVDHMQEDCGYPYKNLCGTGVVYKLAEILYERKQVPKRELYEFLDYTAIATVADVMELTGENRILVKEGLKVLAHTKRIGLQALMKAVDLAPGTVGSYHIGFILGPCFNAAGRLDTVKQALALLKTQDPAEADEYAASLKQMNDERKDMTAFGADRAVEMIENSPRKKDSLYLVYVPDCHESVAGIIAGRIREQYYRPTLIFTDAAEPGMIKASGRSIEAYHMFEELNTCRDLFARFGGHKMAAGLTMEKKNLDLLRDRLLQHCSLREEDLCPVVKIDVPMPLSYISESLIRDLSKLEPFGRSNEKPLFARQHLEIMRLQILGKNHNTVKLSLMDSDGTVMDALLFGELKIQDFLSFLRAEYGQDPIERAMRGMKNGMDLAVCYYPQVNDFRGTRSLQIVIQNYCRIKKTQV